MPSQSVETPNTSPELFSRNNYLFPTIYFINQINSEFLKNKIIGILTFKNLYGVEIKSKRDKSHITTDKDPQQFCFIN